MSTSNSMQYRFMGKSGLKVSELCLGTMTFGDGQSYTHCIKDEQEVYQLMNRFVEKGGNFLDTGDFYTSGTSEKFIGNWLKTKNRDDLVIATKFFVPTGPSPNSGYASRKYILSAVEASLKRLQTDYIDLYQLAGMDPGTPIEETLTTLHDLVRCGKVRYIGAANSTGYQLQKAIDVSRHMGLEVFSCLQPQYSLLCRTTEWELLPIARNEGLGIIPWGILRTGFLAGKFSRNSPPDSNSRVALAEAQMPYFGYSANDNEHTWKVVDTVNEIAKELNKTPSQVSIRWLLQQPGMTAPIMGVRTLKQLDDNLGAVGWNLTDDQMAKLKGASEPALPYPYNFPPPQHLKSRLH